MYTGALHVLQSDNPDRLALAAHNLRELIEKLPDHIDVPAAATGDVLMQPKALKSLTVQVRELLDQWNKVAKQVDGAVEISPRLKTFLGRLREFSVQFEQDKPSGANKQLSACVSLTRRRVDCQPQSRTIASRRGSPTEISLLRLLITVRCALTMISLSG
jgi:hypothetical protein